MAAGDQTGHRARAEGSHERYWATPYLYGEAEALNSMGTIAAPLLAGFSLAAMVQTLTITKSQARWPDAALLLLLLAAVLFVATVQATFWARGYQASPQQIKEWWPDADDTRRMELLRREQKLHAAGFHMWSNRARVTYSAALLCLLAGLTLLAVPPESYGQLSVIRWIAVAVGAVAFVAETLWIIGSFTNPKWLAWLLEPPQDDIGDNRTNGLKVRSARSLHVYDRLYAQAAGQRRRVKTLDTQRLQPKLQPVWGAGSGSFWRRLDGKASGIPFVGVRCRPSRRIATAVLVGRATMLQWP